MRRIAHTNLYSVSTEVISIKGEVFVLVTTGASHTGKVLCKTDALGMMHIVDDIRPTKPSGWFIDAYGDAIKHNDKGDVIDSFTREYCRLRDINWSDVLAKVQDYPRV
ncbi:MAG: hypothetical protein WCK31_04060 [bacterium]